ncbi:tRNA (adenosine(37)-N6)-threonylcarbamoyltransferase complex ATPase subunit type 1 TsaE [Candidatus Sulfidibacterium hydrothermale]|uniref:tRNA (adenosine(37)-N6)-threonylcarbamoyltransferase complex ATPase subunit type 1 TsaE n=1 Tax=Candidatus Sulfidibacterium hydrothermale TaxID=2875962 RepID=UPI001F0A6CA0|nr:tRNA (adenosine(37)-N6)-threonylcarbamoyltransferase complex ATPase subunit type 1 TsaE [Candidatus Sulfidibacterium hydrothermale]UBM61457.1 tRNA (adenosine(37)-N6)-threonylcarbamoyltransferase complex ATPase subunit type 1 TsaE [Candidatus Sulfidibacterium hydrothermale]
MENKIRLSALEALPSAAQKILSTFPDQRIFAFYGEMGAGKTTFIQSFCRQLGSNDNVSSPTFALINEYKDRNGNAIFHFDFYRMKRLEEAFDIGLEEYLYSGNYCFMEWPEKITELLPPTYVRVDIEVKDNLDRVIRWSLQQT